MLEKKLKNKLGSQLGHIKGIVKKKVVEGHKKDAILAKLYELELRVRLLEEEDLK